MYISLSRIIWGVIKKIKNNTMADVKVSKRARFVKISLYFRALSQYHNN